MIDDIMTVFCLSLVLVCITAGCTGSTGNRSPTLISPGGTPVGVASAGTDLTNQASLLAATFGQGESFTPLGPTHPDIHLKKVAGGFSSPMMMAVIPDGSGRMAVVDQTGVVKILTPDKKVIDTPFLDVRDRMVRLNQGYDERGLLSLAFHPDFRNNGRVFVYYSAPLRSAAPFGWSCTNRLSEFHVKAGSPDTVDMNSEKIIFTIDKPFSNHNGGPLLFGPDDGYLYLALGDGGNADDTGAGHTPGIGNAQDGSSLLGKILRIDIDNQSESGKNYAIPHDNPFTGTPGFAPEIYAMGFRNPAYASFDAGGNHTLITAVAGQNLFESVFIVDKGGNYGWNLREGTHCFNPAADTKPLDKTCPVTGSHGEPLIGPIIETGHDIGNTVVGGYIYRGSAVPELTGKYIFGEWSTGFTRGDGSLLVSTPPAGYDISLYPSTVMNITQSDNRLWSTQELRVVNNPDGRINTYVRGFAEDENGELYVLTSLNSGPDPTGTTGEILKIIPG